MTGEVTLQEVIDGDFTLPDAHVAWMGVIAASPEFTMPFPVHVVIFHTEEQLQEACGNPEAGGFSSTFCPRGGETMGAVIFLSKPGLELALVAHEVTHIALHHHSYRQGRGGAKKWLHDHPESVAEMVGNMTALIWYGIPTVEEIDAEAS